MQGKGKLLKVYVGESERYRNKPLYQYLIKWLREKGIAGVTINRGIEGYGQDKVVHTTRLLELSADLPIVLEVVDSAEKIEEILPELCQMVPKGLVFSTDIFIHKYGK
ncbi:DUF190 domain-containing protein [Desulfitobacterium metallireducens]|uniref:Uncharacterized protein n=1 Tax=Desulfitobacterium metallireducens DSM 15288 TaxID=871968 RepID=W0E670_9FIRM|nr:DUF190 domain-containing protein [Desulfitobacterium metallireducens]AHF06232.1 hypothetical protein DESME_03545 [Desulfitobacterium metallireducens DSM 15288]